MENEPQSPVCKENLPSLPEQLQKEVMEGKSHLKQQETEVKNPLPDINQINMERQLDEDEHNKNKAIGSKVILEAVRKVSEASCKLNHVDPVVKNILPDQSTIAREKVGQLVKQFDQKRLSHAETEEKSGDPIGKVL